MTSLISNVNITSTDSHEPTVTSSKNLTYSQALERIIQGNLLKRKAWGTSEFCFLVSGSTFTVSRVPLLGIFKAGTSITYRPHIDKRNTDGSIGTWSPSNEDQLATDWEVVPSVERN